MSAKLKSGYVLTELGELPQEWQVVEMGTIGNFRKGKGIRKDEASSGDIPCIRYGEIYTHHDNVITTFNSWISDSVAETSQKLKFGDILFACSGETKADIGKCAAFVSNAVSYAGGDIIILSPKNANSYFLGYLFNSPIISKQKAQRGQGDAVVHISASALSSINVPLPSKRSEQEAIATALSDMDSLISGLDQLIAKKRNIKQAAMQQLLTGQTRLPGFSGEWEVRRLGEVAALKSGYSFKSSTYTEFGNYKVVTIANVQDGYMSIDECNKIASIPDDIQIHQRLYRDDILISMTGNVGRVCRVTSDDCLLNQRVGKLVPLSISDNFIFHVVSQRRFLVSMGTKAKGGAQGNLSVSDITEFEFSAPSEYAEQIAIAAALSDIETELNTLEASREKARQLKQGMMQELLTGRIRLLENS